MSNIKLGNFTLRNETIKKMEDKIERTKQINKEQGFNLCTIRGENELFDAKHCQGNSCGVKHIPICNYKHQKYVGHFHTHPIEDTRMSYSDMNVACKQDMECIADISGKIDCYVRKRHPVKSVDRKLRKNCVKEAQSLSGGSYFRFDEILEEGKYFEKVRLPKSEEEFSLLEDIDEIEIQTDEDLRD